MTDNDEDQTTFNRDTASLSLELLELARRGHHPEGIDMAEALDNLSSRDPAIVIGASLRVIEASVSLGAGSEPGAYDHRTQVLREIFVELLGRAA